MLESLLIKAIADADLATVNELISKNVDLNVRTSNGMSVVSFAAALGHLEILKTLIAAGANLYAQDDNDLYPLSSAALFKQIPAMKLLASHLNDSSVQDIIALQVGNIYHHNVVDGAFSEVLQTLITDIGIRSTELTHELMMSAVEKNDIRSLELFLKHTDVDINYVNESDQFPLRLAIQHDHSECFQLLINAKAQLDIPMQKARVTPLQLAIRFNRVEMLKQLIAAGADVNYDNGNGICPLRLTVHQNQVDTLKILIDANINIFTTSAIDAAIVAASEPGLLNICKFLDEAAYKIMLKGDYESLGLCLLRASAIGDLEVVNQLISKGADLDFRNSDGVFPLFLAAAEGNEEVLKILIAKGANVDAQDNHNVFPLQIAGLNRQRAAMKLLAAHSNDSTKQRSVLPILIKYETDYENDPEVSSEILQTLIIDVGTQYPHGLNEMLLMSVVAKNDVASLKILLKITEVDIDQLNESGKSALMVAVAYDYVECVQVLIDAKAQIDLPDENGFTALMFAAQFNRIEIVKQLLAANANIYLSTPEGLNAITIAEENGHAEILMLLKKHV